MQLRNSPAILLLVILTQTIVPALPRQQNDLQQQTLALLKSFAQHHDFNSWWEQNSRFVTKEIVGEAEAMGDQAVQTEPETAKVFYSFAGVAYLRLGDRAKALNSMFNVHQVEFMQAQTPEQYRQVRTATLSLEKLAEDSKIAPDVQFSLTLLAADCTFFSEKPEEDKPAGDEWMQAVLADVVRVFEKAGANTSPVEREKLASLASDALAKATSQFFANEDKLEPLLKSIAGRLDTVFPADFAYRTAMGNPAKTLNTAEVFAEVSYGYGDAAAASARLAIAGANARASGDLDAFLSLIYERYRGERRTAHAPAQLRQLRADARAVVNDTRLKYHSRAGRIWNAHLMDTVYGEMLRDQLREESSEDQDQVFAAIEMLKARMLLDDLVVPPVDPKSPASASRIAGLDKQILGFPPDNTAKDDLYMQETRLISHLTSFSAATESVERRKALAELERIYASAGGYATVATPASLAEVQGSLEPSEAIIEYVIPYNELHPASDLGIMLITRNHIELVHTDIEKVLPSSSVTAKISVDGKAPLDFSPLGGAVATTRTAIRSADESLAKRQLRGLYDLLILPLVAKGFRPESYRNLIIVPHGMLQYLPFAALLDEADNPLIKKTAITLAPSSSVWRQLLNRGSPVGRWTAYANPDLAGTGLPALTDSEKEADLISPLMDGLAPTIERRTQASVDRFLDEAPSAGILHIATHGQFPDENALDDHALLLAKGSRADGTLAAWEIRRLKLARTRLVVLSVCNGGLFRMGPADEPYGLMPAFLEAGAQNVMATLWPLDDRFGRQFTVEFYKHLLEDGPAQAFRKACLRFIAEDELTRNWAGFVLVGPGRAFEFSR